MVVGIRCERGSHKSSSATAAIRGVEGQARISQFADEEKGAPGIDVREYRALLEASVSGRGGKPRLHRMIDLHSTRRRPTEFVDADDA